MQTLQVPREPEMVCYSPGELCSAVMESQPLTTERAPRSSLIGAMVESTAGEKTHSPRRPIDTPVLQSIYAAKKNRLNASGTITVEERISPGVLRCFTDPRVLFLDSLMMVSILAMCITSPLTFIWGGDWKDPEKIPLGRSLLVLDVLEDVIYAVYSVLILRISYMHSTRRVEVANQAKIYRQHFHNPLYWVSVFSTTTHFWTALGVSMELNNIKVVRAIRHLLFWPDSMWQLKGRTVAVRVITPIFYLILASHWVACLLSSLGGYRRKVDDEGFDAFTTQFEGHTVPGKTSLYFMAFVESIYLLTAGLDNPLGEGDSVRQGAFGSLLLVAIFGPIGCIVVAVFISAIVREQALWFVLENKHAENKAFIMRALRNFDIPAELQSRVLSLHEYQKMGFDREAFDILFNKNNLSPPLDLALRVYVYHDNALKHSPYFAGKEANYVLDIIAGFEDRIYLPSDYVIRRGQVGDDMFFMIRGEVSILVPDPEWSGPRTPDHTVEVSCKRQGEYFGEIALIRESVRTAWVRANTYVLVSLLTRAHAESIWKHFPHERQQLYEMVTCLAKEDRKRATVPPAGDAYETPSSMALRKAAETSMGIIQDAKHDVDRQATQGTQATQATQATHVTQATQATHATHATQAFADKRRTADPVISFLSSFADESRNSAAIMKYNFLALQDQISTMEQRQVEFETTVRRSLDALQKPPRPSRRTTERKARASALAPETAASNEVRPSGLSQIQPEVEFASSVCRSFDALQQPRPTRRTERRAKVSPDPPVMAESNDIQPSSVRRDSSLAAPETAEPNEVRPSVLSQIQLAGLKPAEPE